MKQKRHQATIISRPARVIEFCQGASFCELPHYVLQKWSTYLAQFAMYITVVKVHDGHQSINLDIFQGISLPLYFMVSKLHLARLSRYQAY